MQNNQTRIREELNAIIAKSNQFLNAPNNKQRATAYLYLIFSLLALSFFGLFAIGPTVTTITNLNKQYEEDKVALTQLKKKNAALKALSAQYLEIQSELNLIDNAIPQSPKIAELTRQLEHLSVKNNLAIQKLDTGLLELFPGKNANTSLFTFNFSISVSGIESDVNNFLSDFINMGRIVKIDKLTTGKKQNDVFTASITGKAFFYKP